MNYQGKAEKICREFEILASGRSNWESHWQEIAERVDPSHSKLFTSFGANNTKGEKRNEFIFDSTAPIALKRFAAIIDSLLTPRNQIWHRLRPSDLRLLKDRSTILWFEEANNLLMKYRYAPSANFSGQNYRKNISLGAYGTGVLFTDRPKNELGLRYRNIHLGEIYLSENHQGLIDKAYRRFNMTLRQLKQKWGDKLPASVLGKIAQNPEMEMEVVHAVEPNDGMEYGRKDYRGMPFSSCYVLKEGYVVLEEGGYSSFPYAVSRHEQAPGEAYGRSPAMDVLPAIKTLNEEKKTVLKQGHRTVDPILLAYDDGVVNGFSLKPGSINTGGVSADGRALVHALPVGNIAIGKELMDDERAIINDAFLVNIFQILVENPQMTATEVMERTKEKAILLAPTIGRQQTESNGPMIERELDLLTEQGLLPPMPPALLEAKGDYTIEFDSPISKNQRAEEAAGIMRTIQTALEVVNVTQNPEPLDFFNWDIIIPEVAQINSVPNRWMKSLEQVANLRQGRAQEMQDQKEIQAAPAAAAMMKAQAVSKKQAG